MVSVFFQVHGFLLNIASKLKDFEMIRQSTDLLKSNDFLIYEIYNFASLFLLMTEVQSRRFITPIFTYQNLINDVPKCSICPYQKMYAKLHQYPK